MALTAIESLALSKVFDKDTVETIREKIQPGKKHVDFAVRVFGSLNVGDDYERKVTNKIDWQAIAAIALSHLNGYTAHQICDEYIKGRPDLDSIKKAVEKDFERLKETTLSPCKGQVKAVLTVEAVKVEQAGNDETLANVA